MCERPDAAPDLAQELLRLTDENLLRLRGAVAAANVITGSLLDRPGLLREAPNEEAGLEWVVRELEAALDLLRTDLERVRDLAKAAA